MNIHGMLFKRPIRLGELVCFESQIVYAGKSRLVAHIEMKASGETDVTGFITFVHVDKEGKPLPHGLTIVPQTPEQTELYEQAKNMRD